MDEWKPYQSVIADMWTRPTSTVNKNTLLL